MVDIQDLEMAISVFEKKAREREKALANGKSVMANKCYEDIWSAFVFLRNQNRLDVFYQYLSSNSIGVQLDAATSLLIYDEEVALEHLKKIASGKGFSAFTATMVISEWTNGNMTNYLKHG